MDIRLDHIVPTPHIVISEMYSSEVPRKTNKKSPDEKSSPEVSKSHDSNEKSDNNQDNNPKSEKLYQAV